MIRDRVEAALCEVIANQWPDVKMKSVRVEPARDKSHGDLATNAAMVLSKQLKVAPREIADQLVHSLRDNDLFRHIEIAGPGFVNFSIDSRAYQELLRTILELGPQYGLSSEPPGSYQQIEFVSANPTGPLNVVSARAAATGDTLARLFEATGIRVDREFYVNDYGNQVDHLVESVQWYLNGEQGEFPEQGYHGDYVQEIAKEAEGNLLPLFKIVPDDDTVSGAPAIECMAALASGDGEKGSRVLSECFDHAPPYKVTEEIHQSILRRWILEKMLYMQRSDLEAFGVRFQSWFRESSVHQGGQVEAAYQDLDEAGYVYEKEGARWFRSTDFGDDEDRVVMRSNGRPTYFLADIAYHRDKIERGYDHAITILGPDHHGHIPRMLGAMQALGKKKDWLEIFIVQQVNLLREGKPVKMSKRAGDFVSLRELTDEVGRDAARFFFVMLRPNTHLNFDLELAKKRSLDNPVYYVQYAHARVCSVFRHAEAAGIDRAGIGKADLALLGTAEWGLLKMLDQFPDIVAASARMREPHRIPTYLKELSAEFHGYYHANKVVSDDQNLSLSRLSVLEAVRIVIRNGLQLLSVSAPEAM